MKRVFTLLAMVVFATSFLFSQNYEIYEKKNNAWVKIQNGATINRACTTNSEGVHETFAVKNIAGSQRTVWARKIKQYQVDKADNAFCWNGCMTPMQYISTKYLAMKPDSLYTRQFEVHFVPQGVAGNTLIIYSFFDRDHLADSAFFSIMYVTQSSGGIPDQESLNFQVGATPNPAINSVRFKGIPAGFDGQLVIANLLGKRIMEIQVLNKAAEPVVDVAELPEGIYFYFLEKANAKGSAGKLIIRR